MITAALEVVVGSLEAVADEPPSDLVAVAMVATDVDPVSEELEDEEDDDEDEELSVALRVPQFLALSLHFSWPSKSLGWFSMH